MLKVKRIFTSIMVLVAISASAFASDFCDGFERGYSSGYKKAKGSSLEPTAPLCQLNP